MNIQDIVGIANSKIASTVRTVLIGGGMLYVGLHVGSQADVDNVVKGVEAVFTSIGTLATAGLAAYAAIMGIVSKGKAYIKDPKLGD